MPEPTPDQSMVLKAYVVADEINLNELAKRYGIPRKYTWEEPLVLGPSQLGTADRRVFVFAFGSVVFVNFPRPEIVRFMGGLKGVSSGETVADFERISDEYEIRFCDGEDFEITDEYARVSNRDGFYDELAATVIAKSAALEKIEIMLGRIEDKVEGMIDKLEAGKTGISNAEVARTTSSILRLQYISISYIMILDKPDLTWDSSLGHVFYDKMADFFELTDRYEIIRKKLDIINNIKEGFTHISYANRGLKIEWAIVILIVAEVVIMLIELFK